MEEKRRDWLYFKSGKPKKKYMLCLSRKKRSELRCLYGTDIVECAGNECAFYSVWCGRSLLKEWETKNR